MVGWGRGTEECSGRARKGEENLMEEGGGEGGKTKMPGCRAVPMQESRLEQVMCAQRHYDTTLTSPVISK